jgi:hypothetical protein
MGNRCYKEFGQVRLKIEPAFIFLTTDSVVNLFMKSKSRIEM